MHTPRLNLSIFTIKAMRSRPASRDHAYVSDLLEPGACRIPRTPKQFGVKLSIPVCFWAGSTKKV